MSSATNLGEMGKGKGRSTSLSSRSRDTLRSPPTELAKDFESAQDAAAAALSNVADGANTKPNKGKGKARTPSTESRQTPSNATSASDADDEADGPLAPSTTLPGRPPSGTHACTLCPRTYARADGLSRHMRSVHAPTVRLHRCPHCSHATARSDNMAKHIRNTHGVGSVKVRCGIEGCGFGEARADRWLEHVVEVHAGVLGDLLYKRGCEAWEDDSDDDNDDDDDDGDSEEEDGDGYEVG